MGGWVKAASLAVIALCVLGSSATAAHAQRVGQQALGGKFEERLAPPGHWIVGVTVDRGVSPGRIEVQDFVDDQLFGVTTTYHRGRFGFNAKLLFTPQRVSARGRAGVVVGARVRLMRILDRTWSYGLAVHGDAILDDHHSIFYVAPIELGFDVIKSNSFRGQLFFGVRYAITGSIIDSVLIDPNGFEHQVFEEILDDKLDNPWEGFVSLVFARRID